MMEGSLELKDSLILNKKSQGNNNTRYTINKSIGSIKSQKSSAKSLENKPLKSITRVSQ